MHGKGAMMNKLDIIKVHANINIVLGCMYLSATFPASGDNTVNVPPLITNIKLICAGERLNYKIFVKQ